MFGMGMPEILMILAIALVVIGPRKLPDLGRSLGRALREFRKATNEFKSSLDIEGDLSDVRRNFNEMNADLKSTLSAAALGDKPKRRPQPEPETPPETPSPSADSEAPAAPTADAAPSEDAASARTVPPDQVDGNARG
ncbi:MAG: twin-arginine translocase TatA/TatE family subunit [Deltaproteobacteria bacterium]|nr:twin-arginine translocase TatA/TatE family subunit [Deltaproteobacteria bacterium]